VTAAPAGLRRQAAHLTGDQAGKIHSHKIKRTESEHVADLSTARAAARLITAHLDGDQATRAAELIAANPAALADATAAIAAHMLAELAPGPARPDPPRLDTRPPRLPRALRRPPGAPVTAARP
jgi:hypothetical protein